MHLYALFKVGCYLKSGSNLPKKLVLFTSRKPFKGDEECFLCHLKSSFRSRDI